MSMLIRFRPLRTALWLTAQTLLLVGALALMPWARVTAQSVSPAKPRVADASTALSTRPVSPHGPKLKEACASCHTAKAWKPARTNTAFKHAPQTFPLTGAHTRTACLSCHTQLDFQKAATNCASCHTDVHQGELGSNCARCHTTRSFVDRGTAVRTHQGSRFPLRGAHAVATCESCHQRAAPGQAQFLARNTSCESCHLPQFRATTSPNHVAAGFGTTCTACHTISTWTSARFDHGTTRFPLTGRHQAVTCKGCHADNTYRGKPTTCVSCHQSSFTAARAPRHDGFPTTCESCHTTAQWPGASFDHDTRTQFPLTGGHKAVNCASCHADGVYKGKPSSCVSCHQGDADKVAMPGHSAARFGPSCESCHSTATWRGGRFDHGTTRFPLTGLHTRATCAACHTGNVFAGRPSTCASCHMPQYDTAKDPDHRTLGFPTSCESCHATSGWTGAVFDHALTRFPLTGAHTPLTCSSCHGTGVYRGTPLTCVGCHQQRFDGTSNPPHAAARFGSTCESCHSTARWTGANWSHSTQTTFPLLGKHVSATCLACHGDRVYAGKPSVCASCHLREFDATTTPNHRTAGIPTTCESCHNANGWQPATFDHSRTRFPLQGAHRAVNCTSCHVNGTYTGTPRTCVGCHQSRFDGTTNPSHRTSGFPTTCESCHSVNTWTPATFNHDATRFPLQGGHRAVNCQGCHADGVYRGKPTTCVSCHQGRYDATTRPSHRANGIGTSCESCHTVNAWTPASFDHAATRFPLTGAHRSATCAACHSDGVYRGKPMACVACHQTDYNGTTNPNHTTARFPTTCESCHTTTTWNGATFNHDPWFPIYSGKHRGKWTNCTQCHANPANLKEFTCLSCHEHNKTKMDDTHKGRSGYRYESSACYSCHARP